MNNMVLYLISNRIKGAKKLIQISRAEAAAIRKKVRHANIRKTRHKFYLEESRTVMRFLNRLRTEGVVATYGETGCLRQ